MIALGGTGRALTALGAERAQDEQVDDRGDRREHDHAQPGGGPVGPRPERGYLVEQFNASVSGYRDRHRLPVGLTGWAQVHGLRGDTSLRERVRFDNQYIEHWSLWRDVVILIRTLSASFRAPTTMSPPELPDRASEATPPAAEGGGN